MADKPPFDPNQPFDVVPIVGGAKPAFDPNKPFQPVGTTSPGKIPTAQPQTYGESFMTGLADPAIGIQQAYTHLTGSPQQQQAVDFAIRQREQEFARQQGSPLARGVGGAVSTAPAMLAGPLAGGGLASGAIGGALSAAAQPTVPLGKVGEDWKRPMASENYWGQKAYETAAGGLFGAGTTGLLKGVGTAIGPELTGSAKTLSEQGVRLTPGQMAGGWWQNLEEKLAATPLLGDVIRAAQTKGIEGWRRGTYNQVLEPIGQKINTRTPMTGREAFVEMRGKIDTAYDRALAKTTFQFDHDLLTDLSNIRFNKVNTLPPEQQTQFMNILRQNFSPLQATGVSQLSQGRLYKTAYSELGQEARNFKNSPSPNDRKLGGYLDDVQQVMRDAIKRQNPQSADELKNVDFAYSMYKRVEQAATRRAGSGGEFMPADLLQAAKSQSSKGVFAAGDALMQEYAQAGANILPKSVKPGTPEKLLAPAGIALALGHPYAAGGIAAGTIPYSPPSLAALNALARSPTMTGIGSIVRRGSPYAAIAASPYERLQTYGGPQE